MTDQSRLTVAVAPSSAHPRLVRLRVDEVTVGDLCFRTDASRDRVVDALVHHAGAEVRREFELITPYDPALVEPRARARATDGRTERTTERSDRHAERSIERHHIGGSA